MTTMELSFPILNVTMKSLLLVPTWTYVCMNQVAFWLKVLIPTGMVLLRRSFGLITFVEVGEEKGIHRMLVEARAGKEGVFLPFITDCCLAPVFAAPAS
jgi:hypothetical protein